MPSNVRLELKTHLFTFIVIATNVVGNFALSWGLKHGPLYSPYVLLGVSLLIVWFLSRMALLSWADLSYVLPVTSIGYVLTAFVGKYFLDEHIDSGRWLGTFLITCGTVLVGTTAPRTARP